MIEGTHRILIGDVMDGLRLLRDGSIHCAVTSPPYWGLRDYGVDGQIGLEPTPEAFIDKMVKVFAEVKRVLRDDGTLWLNIGDSYNAYNGNRGRAAGVNKNVHDALPSLPSGHGLSTKGLKPKDLCMMPWRVALALQADGWYLRSVIVWAKKSPMPESVTDRPTSSWEPIFLMAKSQRYFYDAEAVKEPLERGDAGSRFDSDRKLTIHPSTGTNRMHAIGGVKHAGNNGNATYSGNRPEWPSGRNQRNVWHLGPEPYAEAHFATFPTEIPRRAIKAGTSEKGCCPRCGAPWERVVESQRTFESGSGRSGNAIDGKQSAVQGAGYGDIRMGLTLRTSTIGWHATCECHDPVCGASLNPVPCTVLDPFLGSGTTIAVARQLGRNGVGCELNPAYAELARVRIGKAIRPNSFADQTKVEAAPLFETIAPERQHAGGAAQ